MIKKRKSESEKKAREARELTEKFVKRQKEIMADIKRRTLSVDDAIKFVIYYCEAEEQKRLTEWMH